MATNIPIFDNHLHLDPAGGGSDAILEFQNAGGTHAILSHKPYSHVQIQSAEDYRTEFEITLKMAEKVRNETNVVVYVTLGPYPVELIHLTKKMELTKARQVLISGMEMAADYVRNGQAIALGEIGRPHFDVSEDIMEASNEILLHGMELAHEIGCAVVLHTESTTPAVCEQLSKMADRAGLPRNKVVKHYSPPLISEDLNFGLFPSVLASEKNITSAVKQGTRFMMETDFLDDPKRPGAVLGIKTVPKRTKKLMQEGIITEDDVYTIHQHNPKLVYGIDFE
jgi:TatD-related deoxyribonuclease